MMPVASTGSPMNLRNCVVRQYCYLPNKKRRGSFELRPRHLHVPARPELFRVAQARPVVARIEIVGQAVCLQRGPEAAGLGVCAAAQGRIDEVADRLHDAGRHTCEKCEMVRARRSRAASPCSFVGRWQNFRNLEPFRHSARWSSDAFRCDHSILTGLAQHSSGLHNNNTYDSMQHGYAVPRLQARSNGLDRSKHIRLR